MRVSKRTATPISGKTIDDIKVSLNRELGALWTALNEIIDVINNTGVGAQNVESSANSIRLVQAKDGYHLEARYANGWARVGTATNILNRKD